MSFGSRGFTRARQGVVGFIRVRVGSLCRDKGLLSSFCNMGAPSGRRVHPDSRVFTRARHGVVGFIRIRVFSLVRS